MYGKVKSVTICTYFGPGHASLDGGHCGLLARVYDHVTQE